MSITFLEQSLKTQLCKKFTENEFFPSTSVYNVYRHNISKRGQIFYDDVFSPLLSKTHWNSLEKLFKEKNFYPDLQRVLGFGGVLTEFLIAPLSISLDKYDDIIKLGTLANYIVTTYDMLIDSNISAYPISKNELNHIMNNPFNDITPFFDPDSKAHNLMLHEIMIYFRELSKIVKSSHNFFIYENLKSDISNLFNAEISTKQKNFCEDNISVLIDKSALPFVIMGLPACMIMPITNPQFVSDYRTWLYRFGNFIGLIDDVNDMVNDHNGNRPNRILIQLNKSNPITETDIDYIVKDVTNFGIQIMEDWYNFPTNNLKNTSIKHVLPITVLSWFGGVNFIPDT